MADMISLVEAGLRTANSRHTAIANNIANIHTPNYRRKDIQFKKALADALEESSPSELKKFEPEMVTPKDTPVDGRGNDVDLEIEMGNLMKNSGRYKLCMRLMTKTYRQMELAINQR